MKVCPNCQQQYTDENLNFCLNDGGSLTTIDDGPPPTVMMNQARPTNESNWANQDPFSPWQTQPLQQQQNNPFQPPPQNMQFAQPTYGRGSDQTLPTISLVLGILSILLICCYGGFYFGIAALVVGFIGMNNANNNPTVYGGKGLSIAGMIMGGISFAAAVIIIILALIGNIT